MKTGIRQWNLKKMSMVLTAAYLLSLLPLLILSWYNYPAADDFSMALETHLKYVQTGSVLQAVAENLAMTWHYYTKWMGYFTADFLMSMPPSVFGEHLYMTGTWLLLGMFSFGTLYFLQALLGKAFGMNRNGVRCIAMLILFVTVQCMQEGPQRVEAFYWYAGAINYFFLYGLGLVYLGLLISAIYDAGSSKRKYDIIMASILGFLMGGANYMSALSCAIISALILLAILLLQIRKAGQKMQERLGAVGKLQYLLIPTALMLTGFLCSCLSPGNQYRAAALTTMNPVKAVLMSLYYTLSYAVGDWTNWAVLCLLILMIPLFWKLAQNTSASFGHPFLLILFLYGMISANITPPLYAEGNIAAGRIQSIFWAQYILCLALAVGYLTGWVQRKITLETKAGQDDERLSQPMQRFMLAVLMLWLFGSLLSVGVNSHFYSATSALTDLTNGKAQRYAAQWQERYDTLQDQATRDVQVKGLEVKPELLFFSDISEDPADWANAAMCKYFDKDRIVKVP